ncbi:hypothetical protein [Archangium sp.]|uniref:hypothetical protein n=1 Tax=Archangium sp. TaxID=1872627 RepID=UPI002D59B7E3|nr:hypothetical protein [Archangium sp.]HYO53844.1 hypothetical protein [Archangium sp.]
MATVTQHPGPTAPYSANGPDVLIIVVIVIIAAVIASIISPSISTAVEEGRRRAPDLGDGGGRKQEARCAEEAGEGKQGNEGGGENAHGGMPPVTGGRGS